MGERPGIAQILKLVVIEGNLYQVRLVNTKAS